MLHNTGMTSESVHTTPLSVEGPQPVWRTLNEARELAFTGEIVFETDPEVHAYLDHGIVYYAERTSDVPLGRRLVDAGVLDMGQLERGAVRVGDVEHLGRLFDRDSSIDRDAVVVMAEIATEDLVADLANHAIVGARVTAYRHHPSGVHRWFVAPRDAGTISRPVSEVAQVDTTMLDELPPLPLAGIEADELIIEWDDPIESVALGDDLFEAGRDDASFENDDFVDRRRPLDDVVIEGPVDELLLVEIEEPIDEFDSPQEPVERSDVGDDSVAEAVELEAAEFEVVEMEIVEIEVAELEVVEDPLERGDVEIVSDDAPPNAGETGLVDEHAFSVVWPDVADDDVTEVRTSSEPTTDHGFLEFEMPPLEVREELDDPLDVVSDDVAEAVRRAIAAIESASVDAPVAGAVWEDDLDRDADAGPGMSIADAPPAGLGFAPPTLDMRAEVLYRESSVRADSSSGGNHGERSSALRRLIGGLRRADR